VGQSGTTGLKWLGAGLGFAALWASASTATKIGLQSAQPLVIAVVRFGMAAIIMLVIAHGLQRNRLPQGDEWKKLAIYGLLNITVYLGLYVVAMQNVTAGIGALAVATNPVLISFLSVLFLKAKLSPAIIISLIICTGGVLCAAWPLLGGAELTTGGLVIMLLSMLSYSVGAIYFSKNKWEGLSLFTINGWQTFLGGLFLAPFTLFFFKPDANTWNDEFWLSVSWLAIPVSIGAVQLWLWLLQRNPVRAGFWLFLCPLFGFAFAAWWMGDRISWYTIVGVVLVIGGLILSRRKVARKS